MSSASIPWPRHWGRASQAALACSLAVSAIVLGGALGGGQARQPAADVSAGSVGDVQPQRALAAEREAERPSNRLAASDAKWAGMRAKDSPAFSVALASLDPHCVEDQEGIARATLAAHELLGKEGFRVSAFDIMDTIYRQTADKRVGWSYSVLVREYVRGYAKHGAAQAEAAIGNLLVYP